MTLRLVAIAGALFLVVACGSSPDAAAPPTADSLRATWTALRDAEQRPGAKRGDNMSDAVRAAGDRFRAEFARSDWDRDVDPADEEMTRRGLRLVAKDAFGRDDLALAVRALERTLRLPRDAETDEIETHWLPNAYVAAGRPSDARPLLDSIAARGSAQALLARGDLNVLDGDLERARADWKEAITASRVEPVTETAKQVRTDAYVRTMLVGRTPLEIADDAPWIGGDPVRLAECGGKIVMLLVFEPNCVGCRKTVRLLTEFLRRHRSDGLVVVGLIPRSDTAWAPQVGSADPWSQGDYRTCLDDDRYDRMVTQFHDVLGLGFPLLIAKPRTVMPYSAAMQENLLVIGRDGVTAFATSGHSRADTAVAVASRLLKAK